MRLELTLFNQALAVLPTNLSRFVDDGEPWPKGIRPDRDAS